MGDWTEKLRLETTTRILAEVEAPDAGLLCTENEVLFVNAQGVQRAAVSVITKVSRDGPDLVLTGANTTFVRGSISADKLTLANFFAEVKNAVTQARARREVLLDTSAPAPVTPTPTPPSFTPPQSIPSQTTATAEMPAFGRFPTESAAPPPSDFSAPRSAEPSSFAPRMSAAVAPSETTFQPAGFWWRVLAYIIDVVIIGAASSVISTVLGLGSIIPILTAATLSGSLSENQIASNMAGLLGLYLFSFLLSIIGPWLYFALLESSKQQATVGKLAVGLFISNLNGERITFGQATGRYWIKALLPVIGGIILAVILVPLRETFIAPLLALAAGLGWVYSYVMCTLTPRKQTLYDQISGTLVWKR